MKTSVEVSRFYSKNYFKISSNFHIEFLIFVKQDHQNCNFSVRSCSQLIIFGVFKGSSVAYVMDKKLAQAIPGILRKSIFSCLSHMRVILMKIAFLKNYKSK